jgi:hypothetical protein
MAAASIKSICRAPSDVDDIHFADSETFDQMYQLNSAAVITDLCNRSR